VNEPHPILSYYDFRHGDTYNIFLDEEGEFLSALRYVSSIGRDPIVYSALADIPEPHRSAIEREIDRRTM
jgi:hypothetical protein